MTRRSMRYRKRTYCSKLLLERLLKNDYQNRVARAHEISSGYLSSIELGKTPATMELRAALAEYYGLEPSDLFDGDGYSLEARRTEALRRLR